MTIKHKVIQDYQFVTDDKKIIVLKTNTILENYVYTPKGSQDSIVIDKEIIENNSEFFKILDWKEELHSFIKANKIPQPAILTKKIIPFIDEMFISSQNKISNTPIIVSNHNDEEIKFKESQLESKAKRLEMLEKQLLEEQQKISNKELEFLRREKGITEKIKEIESSSINDEFYTTQIEEIKRKQLEILNKEKEIFEKESQLELLESKERKITQDQIDFQRKLEEFDTRERQILEREAKIKNIDIDDMVLKEINIESLGKKIELREKQLKIDLEDVKNKENFLLEKEKMLSNSETELKKKEIALNKKESDLNQEEINLIDLSNKLEKKEVELKKIEKNLDKYLDLEKFIEVVNARKSEMINKPWFDKVFIPKLDELIQIARKS